MRRAFISVGRVSNDQTGVFIIGVNKGIRGTRGSQIVASFRGLILKSSPNIDTFIARGSVRSAQGKIDIEIVRGSGR